MKVHTKTVIDLTEGWKVLEDECYDYEGPIASCDPVTAAVAGTTALSGIANARSASDQAQAARDANATQYQQFLDTRSDLAPWRDVGKQNLYSLNDLMQSGQLTKPFGASDFQADPGYQFRLQQGLQGIQNQAIAQGQFYSPNFINSAERFAQDYASNEYGNAYNRYVTNQANTFNRLASLAGVGQTAANQIGQYGQQTAANTGNLMMQGAQARGQGAVGVANALNQGAGNLMYYNTLQNYMNRTPNYTPTDYNQSSLGSLGYNPVME